MDKIKQSLTRKIQDLGESFNSNDEDARMDDMSEYILSPYAGSSSMDAEMNTHTKKKSQTRSLAVPDPTNDVDIMDSIESAYFLEHDFDAIDYELKKQFQSEMNLEDLDHERMKLKTQLRVVSKKISILIMEKSPSYNGQLDDLDDIRESLKELIKEVQTIRRALGLAKRRSGAGLAILANEKKKRMLGQLRSTLQTIKTLYETEYQLKDAIEDGQFPLAIRICMEAKEAATTYRHFSCVSDLMSKLVGASALIESELDSALSSLTMLFDVDRYAFVVHAYSILNKLEPASRKLVSHFCNTIERSATTVVLENVSRELVEEENYETICESLPSDRIVSTVRDLCFVLVKVLCIYHSIIRFHQEERERQQAEAASEVPPGLLLSHLSASLYGVFRTALSRLNSLLCCQDFASLKFDDILEIVDMTNRFRRFGRAHFGHSSAELAVSLEKQIVIYFTRYHRERMDELRMFLENESFTLCPVPHQFTIFDLQEFQFLKESREDSVDLNVGLAEGLGEQLDFVGVPVEYVNPFAMEEIKSRRVSEYSNSQSVDEAVLDECPDDPEDHIPPNLCNTALNLLRFFGRYIRMTSLLPSIADNSLPAVSQLFEYFFYSIYHLFGRDGSDSSEPLALITNALDDIRGRISIGDQAVSDRNQPSNCLPTLCCSLNLSFPDHLFGAAERILAIESVEFVSRQLDLVRPVIEGLIRPDDTALLTTLDEFYSQTLSVTSHLRQLIVDCIASRALKLPVLIQSVSAEKWDISELRSQHSQYVDFFLKDFEAFSLRLSTVGESVSLSNDMRELFWNRTIYYAFKALVQGYCEGGRCTTEGRALMQLDFQNIQIKLESICGLKPVPHTGYVDGYIKAYYLPESGLEQWIQQHTEYTSKQMISLLGVASHVSKKAKTRIISALND